MPKYQFLFLNQIQASHHHIKYIEILNCAGCKVTRENLEFLVKHVFLQQYRNINTAFVPDNSKKDWSTRTKWQPSLLITLLDSMNVHLVSGDKTNMPRINNKMVSIFGHRFWMTTNWRKMGALSFFRQALRNVIFHDVISSNLFKIKNSIDCKNSDLS